jgi:anti-anti-sigma factor
MLKFMLKQEASVAEIILEGRFDSSGAISFDREMANLAADCLLAAIDMTKVDFLASAGIRSLLTLAKELHSRGGALRLLGVRSFVRDVLKTAGLTKLIAEETSLEAVHAEARALAIAGGTIVQSLGDQKCRIARRPAVSSLLTWGSRPSLTEGLVPVGIEELGIAFGNGGLGQSHEQAHEGVGPFIATSSFVGVAPHNLDGMTDFLLPVDPIEIYVSDAFSLVGNPTAIIDPESASTVTMGRLVENLFKLKSAIGDNIGPTIGFALETESVDSSTDRALVVGIACDTAGEFDECSRTLLAQMGAFSGGPRFWFRGHAVTIESGKADAREHFELEEYLRKIGSLECLHSIIAVDADTTVTVSRLWLFAPDGLGNGNNRRIPVITPAGTDFCDEWHIIVARICSDASRIELTPLSGGFSSKTFRVAAYDQQGRRQIPTVIKIGSIELTQREIDAYHACAEKFILNNSTTIMGSARCGQWAGLRYNFVGVAGPDSRIVWMEDEYRTRPVEEVLRLLDRLYTDILKPWYGQPLREVVSPYRDHDPGILFHSLLADAEREYGISADTPALLCPELGRELPNPYYFYKYEYPRRRNQSFKWHTGITHGDLNLKNVLIDENENLFVIDFSEAKSRNIVADFARLEPIVSFELTHLEDERQLRPITEFLAGLMSVDSLQETPPFTYTGSDPMVEKAYRTVCRLRSYANAATSFENDLKPYLLALLEWTLPVVSYMQFPILRKRLALYSSALMVERLIKLPS